MGALCVAPVIMLMLVVPAGGGAGSARLGCRE